MDREEAAATLARAMERAGEGLIDRQALVEAVVLGAVAGEHLLVIGPPGTAKSEAVRRVAGTLGGRYFEYLLGRFTEPNELFGPVDLRRLREGVVEIETAGMLPDAEIAFLDEVFLGSTAILNTLLGILNERRFRRGHTSLACPLRICVGASNALPEDDALAAFADRFLLRFFVERTSDPMLEALLEGGWALSRRGALLPDDHALAALSTLSDALPLVSLDGARDALAQAVRTLRKAGVTLSDRRVVRSQRAIAAAALLDGGRTEATEADLWPLLFVLPTPEAQAVGREKLAPLLTRARNRALGAAALAASHGPAARASALQRASEALLPAPTAPGEAWALKAEGVLREIDAAFAPDALPPGLRDARAALLAALPASP